MAVWPFLPSHITIRWIRLAFILLLTNSTTAYNRNSTWKETSANLNDPPNLPHEPFKSGRATSTHLADDFHITSASILLSEARFFIPAHTRIFSFVSVCPFLVSILEKNSPRGGQFFLSLLISLSLSHQTHNSYVSHL